MKINISKRLIIFLIFFYGLWTMDYGLLTLNRGLWTMDYGLATAIAGEKQWGGGGDGASWEDADNWSPAAIPALSDDVTISAANAEVVVSETFSAKSITVGGRGVANFTSSDFVYGTITPAENTDNALFIRKDGTVTMKGTGDVTLKGAFKNSEETLANEPAFMFEAS